MAGTVDDHRCMGDQGRPRDLDIHAQGVRIQVAELEAVTRLEGRGHAVKVCAKLPGLVLAVLGVGR